MIKYLFYIFIFFINFYNSFTIQTYAKNQLFIQEDHFNKWLLTKNYNQIWLTSTQQNDYFTIKLSPYNYSLKITASLKNVPHHLSIIELDVGDFICELKQVNNNNYEVILEPINVVQFIDALKQQKTLQLIVDDKNYTISLTGINEAMDEMENFAKDHYIILPPPFSSKLDEFTTMDIPSIIPSYLYPLFRQQAALSKKCKKEKKNKEACQNQRATLLNLLKQNNICEKETNQFTLSYGKSIPPTYQWVNCNSSLEDNN